MLFRMVYKSGQIFLPFCHNTRVWQTDGRTDEQTEFSSQYRVCITCSAVKIAKFFWEWSQPQPLVVFRHSILAAARPSNVAPQP